MGLISSNDSYAQLTKKPMQLNSKPVIKYYQLKTTPNIKTTHYQIVFSRKSDDKIQCIYRFFANTYILIEVIKKKQINNKSQGYFTNGQLIYGYKVKYRYKIPDKIKNILYKKRIHGDVRVILDTLAELKLLSVLQIGPYLGTMINNTDGFLYDDYAEYYIQTLVNFKYNSDNLVKKLQRTLDNVDLNCLKNIGFSVLFHDLVLRPDIFNIQKQSGLGISQIPLQNTQFMQNPRNNSSLFGQNPSQNIIASTMQDKNLKQIKAIDQKTQNLSAIQNYLIHKNVQKAINLYQETVNKIQNSDQKINYIYNFVQLLSDNGYFKHYQQQIITQTLMDTDIKWQKNQTKQLRKNLQQKVYSLKLSSKQFSSQNQLQQFSQSYSIHESSIQKQKLKINIQDSNKIRVKQLIKQMNMSYKTNRFGNSNNTYNGVNKQLNYQYAEMLMKSGKSRLALILFQFLLRDQECSQFLKYKIRIFIGLIYYYRQFHKFARKQWQLAASKIIKMRYYSPALTLIYNNIACSFYVQGKCQRALQILNYALSHQYGHNDYNALLRNNRGLTYLALNQQKQAKSQFMQILSRGQPINNAIILYKVYANLGYMNMKSKQFTRAKQDFKIAAEIQQRCLIPNDHPPSPYMHNNIAMLRYKMRDYRQALDHYLKYLPYFQQLKGKQALMVNYNIALAYKECYKNQIAKQYIQKCKRILAGLRLKDQDKYQKKLQTQAQNISKNNIDEVDDESSGAVLDAMMSIVSRKQQYQYKDDVYNKTIFQ